MYEQSTETEIWNRACGNSFPFSKAGDQALHDLLKFHSVAMNGGVLHAMEFRSPQELAGAQIGYRYFGFHQIANLIETAEKTLEKDGEGGLDHLEEMLDREYELAIPSDETLGAAFEAHFRMHPAEYAPIHPERPR